MNNKIKKTTNLAKLTLRFIKEQGMYQNFIKRTKIKNKTLTNLMQFNTLKSILSFITDFAMEGIIPIERINPMSLFNKEKFLTKYLIMINDFENFLYENMHKKNKIILFHQFLDENNIRKQFYDNLKKTKEPYTSTMNGYYSNLNMLINDAFDWGKSNEGFEFWSDKHIKLQIYTDKIFKKGIIK